MLQYLPFHAPQHGVWSIPFIPFLFYILSKICDELHLENMNANCLLSFRALISSRCSLIWFLEWTLCHHLRVTHFNCLFPGDLEIWSYLITPVTAALKYAVSCTKCIYTAQSISKHVQEVAQRQDYALTCLSTNCRKYKQVDKIFRALSVQCGITEQEVVHEGMMLKLGVWLVLVMHQGFGVGAQDDENPCEGIELYRSRPGPTYNDPSSSFMNLTARECCRTCIEDPRCVTWSWNLERRACGLRDYEAELRNSTGFHSGLIGGERVSGNVPVERCLVERGVRYSGNLLRTVRGVRNARRCCRMCEDNRDCFSWHWRRRGGRVCTLNSNVPSTTRDRRSFGGTIF